jgi:hypothetical protein
VLRLPDFTGKLGTLCTFPQRWSLYLEFEHLLEVDDQTEPISREDLWFGLLCRAEDARPFLPGLERCQILERHQNELLRELCFGQALIRDRVRWSTPDWISFEIEAMPGHAGGCLTISIEESETGLSLRFRYRTDLPEAGGEDEKYTDILRAAYYRSDLDTLRVIREIARSARPQ